MKKKWVKENLEDVEIVETNYDTVVREKDQILQVRTQLPQQGRLTAFLVEGATL